MIGIIIVIMMFGTMNAMNEPTSTIEVMAGGGAVASNSSDSSDDVCEVALTAFMKRTESDIAKYIRPHLASTIKDIALSPDSDSDSDSSSPKRIIKTWVKYPESIRTTPRTELDEVVLASVKKAFEDQEADIAHKSKKIDGMFTKKQTTVLTAIVGVIVSVVSSLAGAYGTLNNSSNCSK